MTQEATNRFIDALKTGAGLKDEFIYYMSLSDYQMFPDPFPRTKFTVREVQESIRRYANPQNPSELFQWDIHGRLFTPAEISLPNTAVVMIHGGAANEYEFIFTPDGPEDYPDLTQTDPTKARVGVAQHIASLGVPVLAISLPGHYRRKPWPSIAERRPEFVIGEVPMMRSSRIVSPSTRSECAWRRSKHSSKKLSTNRFSCGDIRRAENIST